MPEVFINDESDPRLDPYRDLTTPRAEKGQEHFIAEGWIVVERLLKSQFKTDSILISQNKLSQVRELFGEQQTVFVLPNPISANLVGYQFHRGILACGLRRSAPTLESFFTLDETRSTIVVCPQTTDPVNLGQLVRLAAAFGVKGLILGRGSADPFSRRCLRLSMGNSFTVPVFESESISAALLKLKNEYNFQLLAADSNAREQLCDQRSRNDRLALLFGNEGYGLTAEHLELCDQNIAIEMSAGTDSLNVASSAAIFLHHYTQVL